MALTKVVNLDNETELFYDLPPAEAVRSAFAQDRKDYSWWSYEERYPLSTVNRREHGRKTVFSLGSFSTVADTASL